MITLPLPLFLFFLALASLAGGAAFAAGLVAVARWQLREVML